MKKLEKEYRKVKADLDPIKKKAQEAPEIRKASKAFRRSLVDKMVELEPRAREWLGRAHDLEQEVRTAKRERADDDMLEGLQQELDEVREKVDRIEADARADEDVHSERRKLRQQVLDKMRKLDSRVPQWLEQRRQLVAGMKTGRKS